MRTWILIISTNNVFELQIYQEKCQKNYFSILTLLVGEKLIFVW